MENQDRSNNKNVSLSLIAEYGGSESDSDTESRSNTGNDDSDATELSEMVLKNNIINACAHGPLNRAVEEDDDEYELAPSGHMIIDSQSGDIGYEVAGYRDDNSDSETSTSDSDSEVDSVKEIEEISSGDEESGTKAAELKAPKVNGELGIEDLPPIEDLAISLPAQETTKIGTIFSIVEQLVVVKATPGSAPVDLDSVLFLENGAKALGKVFDVFGPVLVVRSSTFRVLGVSNEFCSVSTKGIPTLQVLNWHSLLNPGKKTSYLEQNDMFKNHKESAFMVLSVVTEPHYAVRFNSAQHVAERGVTVGCDVFVAPQSRHTTYVFLPDLMKMKGSDASWMNDIEPPPSHIEYSDDEDERRAKNKKKQQYLVENEDGENSNVVRKVPERRNQRPSESSSRFGSGPSRGRNPFSAGSRRNPNTFQRFARPYMEVRTPPPHPIEGNHNQFGASPNFPMFPPPFHPNTPPPPFMYQYPRLRGPVPLGMMRPNAPVFGSPFCNMPGPQPQWVNSEPPPPPGT